VRLLLIADTHVPTRARDLPARVWDEVAKADVVVHAGDWIALELLDELESRSARLIACWGYNDEDRVAPAESGLADGSPQATVLQLPDRERRQRGTDGRRAPSRRQLEGK